MTTTQNHAALRNRLNRRANRIDRGLMRRGYEFDDGNGLHARLDARARTFQRQARSLRVPAALSGPDPFGSTSEWATR